LNLPTLTKFFTTVTHDKWTSGYTDPLWALSHRELTYVNSPFNDEDTLKQWKDNGHHYDKYTGDLINHNNCPDWAKGLVEGIGLDNIGVSLYKMAPGCILPGHQDTYQSYKKVFDIKHNRVYRVIVFLEDWASGHYLEVDSNPITNWRAGDWIGWHYDTHHVAANIGTVDRYTLQITGTYDN